MIVVYDAGKNLTDRIYNAIDNYNDENFADQNLKVSNLILSDQHSMTMVSSFEGKEDALQYFRKFKADDAITERSQNSKIYKFVITKDNFNIFYQSKDLEAYLRFFDRQY